MLLKKSFLSLNQNILGLTPRALKPLFGNGAGGGGALNWENMWLFYLNWEI